MYFRCWNPFCVWRRVNSDEKCEVPSSQPSMDSAVEQPKGGIPEDCPVNMARRVTQLPHIDRVTYAQPRVRMQASRTNKKKRPSPQIFFTPPTLSTTPSNAGSGVIVRGPVLPMLTVISGVFFMLLRHTWHTVHIGCACCLFRDHLPKANNFFFRIAVSSTTWLNRNRNHSKIFPHMSALKSRKN